MKKILFTLLFIATINAQNIFLLNNFNLSNKKNQKRFSNFVEKNINQDDYLIINGNFTNQGLNTELTNSKQFLEPLCNNIFVIPGINEYKWSESAGLKFREYWNDDKFSFTLNNYKVIGITSAKLYSNNKGYLSKETLDWLQNEIDNTTEANIILISNFSMLNNISNINKALNILSLKNSVLFISNSGSGRILFNKKNGLEEVQIPFSFNFKEKKYNFTKLKLFPTNISFNVFVNNRIADSLKIPIPFKFTKKNTDSSDIDNYSVEILLERNFNETIIAEPVIYHNKIITASYSGIVTCLDSTGTIIWDYDCYGNIVARPEVTNGQVIVGTIQGDLISLNLETGDQLQSIGFDESILSQISSFNYEGDKTLMTANISASPRSIIFATSSGKIYCYHLDTFEEIWQNHSSNGIILGKPILIGNKIILNSLDGFTNCIDANTGLLIWEWSASKELNSTPVNCIPVTDGKAVYFTTPDGAVTALDLQLGAKIWRKGKYKAYASIGISKDFKKLFFKSKANRFHFINPKNGKWIREIITRQGEDKLKCELFENNGLVIFPTESGDVFRINKKYFYKKLFNMGKSDLHSIQRFNKEIYLASNRDGYLILFKLIEKKHKGKKRK